MTAPAAGAGATIAPSDDPATDVPSSDSSSGASNSKFGEDHAWEDGLDVVVSAPKVVTNVNTDFEDSPHKYYLASSVTITNNTGKNYDPSTFSTTLSAGQEEGEEVFDTEHGFKGSPDTVLLASRSVKFKIGYGVNTQTDLVMEVTPGFDYNAGIFAN